MLPQLLVDRLGVVRRKPVAERVVPAHLGVPHQVLHRGYGRPVRLDGVPACPSAVERARDHVGDAVEDLEGFDADGGELDADVGYHGLKCRQRVHVALGGGRWARVCHGFGLWTAETAVVGVTIVRTVAGLSCYVGYICLPTPVFAQ
ncbi:hypothetical protein MAPG_11955 [Magnaporthiopsis poae ATCC 64411]|uniref:Uncharacterized protein n=1 Tax=Magnaporthiopsis poae (strain ATCC 64411 / 73-15) TaxID=644358 RepID=A0A0C4EGK0_MAGP6|nr:hypothetical protein MAPG_11955 [Magnaporthiopsis poae ATCC 64411]